MNVYRSFRNRGFTIIEIVIAAAVLALFFLVVFRVYQGIADSVQRTRWTLSAQTTARNGLNFMREEMQRASYRTIYKRNSVDVEEAGFEFHVADGTTSTDKTLAQWSIGIPFEGGTANIGAVYDAELKLSGRKVLYTKKFNADTGGTVQPGEKTYNNFVVLENVASITLNVEPFLDAAVLASGSLVEIWTELRHPDTVRYPHVFIIEKTGAKVEVEVKKDL
jgi:prepilin-type N-terminal cleavage/methylation domain-containing protein